MDKMTPDTFLGDELFNFSLCLNFCRTTDTIGSDEFLLYPWAWQPWLIGLLLLSLCKVKVQYQCMVYYEYIMKLLAGHCRSWPGPGQGKGERCEGEELASHFHTQPSSLYINQTRMY